MITVVGLLIKYYVKKIVMWSPKKSWRPIAKKKKNYLPKKTLNKLRKNQAQLNWHMFSQFWKGKKKETN
jgi:transposase